MLAGSLIEAWTQAGTQHETLPRLLLRRRVVALGLCPRRRDLAITHEPLFVAAIGSQKGGRDFDGAQVLRPGPRVCGWKGQSRLRVDRVGGGLGKKSPQGLSDRLVFPAALILSLNHDRCGRGELKGEGVVVACERRGCGFGGKKKWM